MEAKLDPRIERQVAEFGRRRRRLILLRGLYAGLASLVVLLSLVALADALWFLEDRPRLLLSLGAYALVGAVLWFTCLRWLWRKPDLRRLARLFETADPEFRESLLSAVELGDPLFGQRWDSEVFRAVLQEEVAARVDGVSIRRLLPGSLIAGWRLAAVLVLLLFVVLLCLPGVRYPLRFLRALVPVANLERVSSVQIRVLKPEGGDLTVPQGDSVTVLAEVSDPRVENVLLESMGDPASRGRARMQPLGGGQFSAVVQVGRASLQYRIRAGDGMTRRFLLHALPRPQIVEFVKTFRYPDYLKLPEHTVREGKGDLAAVDGAKVTVAFRPNVPLARAVLRTTRNGAYTDTPLELHAGGRRLQAEFEITHAGTYQMLLTAARSGFESQFNPEYEIRVLADALPRVTLEAPAVDQSVQAEDIVELRGSAEDDFALADVRLLHRVGGGAWQETPLPAGPSPVATPVALAWDVLALRPKPGDAIQLKLVALDRKGSRAESVTRTLTVTAPGIDLAQLGALGAMNGFHGRLGLLNRAVGSLAGRAQALQGEIVGAPDPTQRLQTLSKLMALFQDADTRGGEADARLKEAFEKTGADAEARDLELAGRLLSRVRRQELKAAQTRLDAAGTAAEPAPAQRLAQEGIQRLTQAAGHAAVLERAYAVILAEDEARLSTLHLRDMTAELDKILRLAEEAKGDKGLQERVERRRAAAVSQVKVASSLLESLAGKPVNHAGHVRNVRNGLLAAVPDAATPAPQLQAAHRQALGQLLPVAADLVRQAEAARQEILAMLGPAADSLRVARQLVEDYSRKDAASDTERREAWTRATAQLSEAALELRDRAVLQERRRSGDTRFAQDMSRLSESLTILRDELGLPAEAAKALPTLDTLAKVADAVEAGHALHEAATQAALLADRERTQDTRPGEALAIARDWRRADRELQTAEAAMRKAELPKDTQDAVAAVLRAPELEAVRREMNAREADANRAPAPSADALAQAAAQLAQARDQIQPLLTASREVLARTAPPLEQRLAELARRAAELKRQTETLAAAPAAAPTTQEAAREQLAAQAEFNQSLDLARDAIRRDANAQDLAAEEGRARARDADDALALLRQPPPKAEDLLRQAAETDDPEVRQESFDQAGRQQERLAASLDQIAQHYDSFLKGQEEASRQALRRAEEAMGLKDTLDREYGRVQRLTETARSAPEQMLARLETELKRDPAMREELRGIAADTMERAAQELQAAAARQQQLAEDMNRLTAAQAPQTQALAEAAQRVAERARQLGGTELPQQAEQAKAAKLEHAAALEGVAHTLQETAERFPTSMASPDAALAAELKAAATAFEKSQQELQAAAQKAAAAIQDAQRTTQQTQAGQNQAANQVNQALEQARQFLAQAKGVAQQSAQQAQQDVANAQRQAEAQKRTAEAAQAAAAQAAEAAAAAARDLAAAAKVEDKAEAAVARQAPNAEPQLAAARQALEQSAARARAAEQAAIDAGHRAALAQQAAREAEAAWKDAQATLAAATPRLGSEPATAAKPAAATPPPPADPQALAEQARDVVRQAGELAARTLPEAVEQARAAGVTDTQALERAAQRLGQVAQRLPTELNAPTPEQAQQVAALAQEAEGARAELQAARHALAANPPPPAAATAQAQRVQAEKVAELGKSLAAAAEKTAEVSKDSAQLAGDLQQEVARAAVQDAVDEAARALAVARQLERAAQQNAEAVRGKAEELPPAAAADLARAERALDQQREALAARGRALAADLGSLKKDELAAATEYAEKAGLDVRAPLAQAAQAVEQAAAKLAAAQEASAQAQQAQQLAEAGRDLERGRNELRNAVARADQAADAARQAAERARSQEAAAQGQAERAADAAQALRQAAEQAAREAATAAADRAAAEKAVAQAQSAAADNSPAAAAALETARQALQQKQTTEAQAQARVPAARQAAAAAEGAAQQAAQVAADAAKTRAEAEQQWQKTVGAQPGATEPAGLQELRAAAQKTDNLLRAAADLAQEQEQQNRAAQVQDAIGKAAQAFAQAAREGEAAQERLGAVTGPQTPDGADAARRAQQAAQEAAGLAQQARSLAGQVENLARQADQPLQTAAQGQSDVQQEVGDVGADLARAGRHETRLANRLGRDLQEAGEGLEATSRNELNAAREALGAVELPAQAQPLVADAQEALHSDTQAAAAALAKAIAQAAEAEKATAAPRTDGQPAAEVSRWLAQALDRLDERQNTPAGEPGEPVSPVQAQAQPRSPAPAEAAQAAAAQKAAQQASAQAAAQAAMQQALQAQAQAMAAARNSGRLPGETGTPPAAVAAAASTGAANAGEARVPGAPLPPIKPFQPDATAQWGRLPTSLARDLMDSRGEAVPEEYRAMVDAYYRVIAEQSKDKPR